MFSWSSAFHILRVVHVIIRCKAHFLTEVCVDIVYFLLLGPMTQRGMTNDDMGI